VNGESDGEQVPQQLMLVFAPLHKRAMGVAVGAVTGLLVFLATVAMLLRGAGDGGYPLSLLSEYYFGYTVTWPGSLVGLAWGFVSGFVFGWFFAFCRNLIIAVWLFIVRTRAELSQARDFVDHI
jgi:hypothetical protein